MFSLTNSEHPKETLCLHYPNVGYYDLIRHVEHYKKGKLSLNDIAQ